MTSAAAILQDKPSTADSDAYVALRPEPFADLQRWLEQVGRFWNDRLDAFRRHVERQE